MAVWFRKLPVPRLLQLWLSPFSPLRLSLEGLPTSAKAVKATLQSPSTRILDHSATFLVFQSLRPWSLGKRNLMYWALIGGATTFLVLVLDVYMVPSTRLDKKGYNSSHFIGNVEGGLLQFLDENDRLFQMGTFSATEGLYWTVNHLKLM